jgi:hypothetical protein
MLARDNSATYLFDIRATISEKIEINYCCVALYCCPSIYKISNLNYAH